jgi:hypothetical protein
LRRTSGGARRLRTAVAYALPALVALARFKLCALCGFPVHWSLLDVGSNVDGDGAAGGAGAAAAGNGWPGGVDPYPILPGAPGYGLPGEPGYSGSGDSGGAGNSPPWWSKYIPDIPLPGGFSVNPQSGEVSAPDIPVGGGFGINPNTGRVDFPGGTGSVGASPGGAGDGIVNVITQPVGNTPWGPIIPGSDTTVGINQQNVPVGNPGMGGGTASGSSILNGTN